MGSSAARAIRATAATSIASVVTAKLAVTVVTPAAMAHASPRVCCAIQVPNVKLAEATSSLVAPISSVVADITAMAVNASVLSVMCAAWMVSLPSPRLRTIGRTEIHVHYGVLPVVRPIRKVCRVHDMLI
jgi:hypothetical protein